MIEVRPIRHDEADAFLALLCDVFDLDHARARSIFFTEPLFDLQRKWALFDRGQIASILTTVPLEFGWGKAAGIAGVATARNRQGEGLAGRLLEEVVARSEDAGEDGLLLFAKDTRLYERHGFRILDHVLRGPIRSVPEFAVPTALDVEEVRRIYDRWAAADDARLRRDLLRWSYWRWNLRVCTAMQDGYLCFEGGIVREVVLSSTSNAWHLPIDTEWLGLSTMAQQVGVELETAVVDLQLMGRGIPRVPQLFMTDQF